MRDLLPEIVVRELGNRQVVLAVSGGRDSMSLLHAAAAHARASIACVATFDHATGAHARRAAALARREARALGIAAVSARAPSPARSEAEWRAQRWHFLRGVARERRASIATAHTRDDQIETVLMRAMRGAGARGLAGLAAESPIVRPLLGVPRAEIASYAARERVRWVEDPSNASAAHLRNRIRHDLLPALARARPSLPAELLELGARAAALRSEVERYVNTELGIERDGGAILVAREMLLGYDAKALALLWPAIAALAGATLDRRGTERLVAFTNSKSTTEHGARVQLSGGFETVCHRGAFIVRRAASPAAGIATPLAAGVELGEFRFDARDETVVSLWSAALPAGKALTVRAWRPGDRMVPHGGSTRRIKGLLRDAGIDAARRTSWPVVLVDEEIVWVPGVRRSVAASARSGWPVVTYHCERLR